MIDKAVLALPGVKRILIILAACGLGQAALIIGQAWSLSSAVTALWLGGTFDETLVDLAVFLLCFISQQGLISLADRTLDQYATQQAKELRSDLVAKVFETGRTLTQSEGAGNITTTILEGVDQVETYLRLILPKITGMAVIPLVLLIWAFAIDWVSGIIMALTFPFIILYMIILGHTAQDKAAKQYHHYRILANHFTDSLRGLDTLKFFGISKAHGESIFQVSEQFREATIKTLRVATLSSLVLDLFATLSLAGVAIMLGMRLLDGTIELFPALTMLIVVPQFYKTVRDFAADYHASLDGKNALKAIDEIKAWPVQDIPQRVIAPWGVQSHLQVQGLGYSYPDHSALNDISFEAQGYLKVGIIGMSGSGKSTLIDVLGGFQNPNQGKILIDGVSLDSLKQADWQKQLAYLPQDPYVFHASLRENVSFYYPKADDKTIEAAIQTAGLAELLAELPQGLDTIIGEGERALSGGQAQRLALARTFLDTSRRILLFDEPTAHLDVETERELKEHMLPLMENRLVFFATHRLHWLNEMDSVIVLKEGMLFDVGSLAELEERHGSLNGLLEGLKRGDR